MAGPQGALSFQHFHGRPPPPQKRNVPPRLARSANAYAVEYQQDWGYEGHDERAWGNEHGYDPQDNYGAQGWEDYGYNENHHAPNDPRQMNRGHNPYVGQDDRGQHGFPGGGDPQMRGPPPPRPHPRRDPRAMPAQARQPPPMRRPGPGYQNYPNQRRDHSGAPPGQYGRSDENYAVSLQEANRNGYSYDNFSHNNSYHETRPFPDQRIPANERPRNPGKDFYQYDNDQQPFPSRDRSYQSRSAPNISFQDGNLRPRPAGLGGERDPLPAFKSVRKDAHVLPRPGTATGVMRPGPERQQVAIHASHTEPNTPIHSRLASVEDVNRQQTWDLTDSYRQAPPNNTQFDLPERPITAPRAALSRSQTAPVDPNARRAFSSEEHRPNQMNLNAAPPVFEMPGDVPPSSEGSMPPLHRAQTAGLVNGNHSMSLDPRQLRRQQTDQPNLDAELRQRGLPPSMRIGPQFASDKFTASNDLVQSPTEQLQGSQQPGPYADVFDRGDFGMPAPGAPRQGLNEYGQRSYDVQSQPRSGSLDRERIPPAANKLPSVNPNALPYHPAPVRPGLIKSASSITTKSAPARTNTASVPGSNERRVSQTVTVDELNQLRQMVQSNPGDSKTQLRLAKKLIEASKVLANEGGRADPKTTNKNRERYVLEAHKIIKRLVASDYAEAMFYLADCYGNGDLGLVNDPKEAFSLYQAAAKLGHPAAAYRTAVCCEIGPEDGGGTRKDLQKAFQWYKRAASLGDIDATYKLGIILLNGLLGQAKSPGEAVGYLKRAADRADSKNPHALHELGLLYESPDRPGIIVRDEAYAFEMFSKAADLGFKMSQFKLGQAYEYGLLGCPIDARNSIVWYTKAAAQGEHQSELALSGWYLTGSEGILEHSDTEAYLWARKAACAEPPLPKAMFAMGYFTEVGIGCPASIDEAKRWYGRAAAYRFPKAQERLEELRKGGSKAAKQLTRSNQKQTEADCKAM